MHSFATLDSSFPQCYDVHLTLHDLLLTAVAMSSVALPFALDLRPIPSSSQTIHYTVPPLVARPVIDDIALVALHTFPLELLAVST